MADPRPGFGLPRFNSEVDSFGFNEDKGESNTPATHKFNSHLTQIAPPSYNNCGVQQGQSQLSLPAWHTSNMVTSNMMSRNSMTSIASLDHTDQPPIQKSQKFLEGKSPFGKTKHVDVEEAFTSSSPTVRT